MKLEIGKIYKTNPSSPSIKPKFIRIYKLYDKPTSNEVIGQCSISNNADPFLEIDTTGFSEDWLEKEISREITPEEYL